MERIDPPDNLAGGHCAANCATPGFMYSLYYTDFQKKVKRAHFDAGLDLVRPLGMRLFFYGNPLRSAAKAAEEIRRHFTIIGIRIQ